MKNTTSRAFGLVVLLTTILAACSVDSFSSNAIRPHAALAGKRTQSSVTPPPAGSTYTYAFTVTNGATSQSGNIVATWTAGVAGAYRLALSSTAVLPFLQSGSYTFAAGPNGYLKETFSGFSTSSSAAHVRSSSSLVERPPKLVATFPLVASTPSSVAVQLTTTSSFDDTTNRCHPEHTRASNTIDADGSYGAFYHEQDYPGCIGDGYTTTTSTLAGNGSGTSITKGQIHSPPATTTSLAWALPIERNGTFVIPLGVTRHWASGNSNHETRYVADWYPAKNVPSPLSSDVMSAGSAVIPMACTGYAGQAAMATTESVKAVDPIEGTIVATNSTSYYISGGVALVCGESSTVKKTFDNKETGKMRSAVTTQTIVVLVPPAADR